ncbi:MAG: PAS domain S-box protein [Magnetococcales bacterium]|nr:PAS domain S-box protein [Magnetococcales bacterium]
MGANSRKQTLRSLDRPVFGVWPLAVFLVLLVASVGTVLGFAQLQKAQLKQEFQEKMLAIGTLKARQIDDWVEKYYRDALLLQKSSMLSQGVGLWLRQGRQSDDLSRMIASRLNSRKDLLQYRDITLLAENGEVLLATSAGAGIDAEQQQLVRQSMADGQIHFSLIRLDPSPAGGARLDMITPLELEGQTGVERIAALLLSINVDQFLYPLLEEWPTPSRTAETLLVTRDGDGVLFLNELRHRKNTALRFRLPIVAGSDIPAVRGVTGEHGIMEGVDYRREPVLAATIPMKRMPWVMIAKIDQDEVYAPLRMQTWFSAVGILFVVLIAIIGLRLWWVNNTQTLLRKGMDRLNRSQQLALVGSWDWDPYPDREVWSDTLHDLLGVPMGSVASNRTTFQERIHPDERAQVMQELYAQIEQNDSFIRSYRIVRPDGEQRFVLEKGAIFRDKAGRVKRVIGVLRDVSERRMAEEQEQYYIRQLEKSNRAYRALSRCNAIGYYAREEGQLFRDVCAIIQECCGYRLVWIGLPEQGPEQRVRLVAHAGFDASYLENLLISWGESELGQGPTGRAIRTGQPVLNQNVDANPAFSPWRKAAGERGYASSSAFPICYAEHCLGVLNIYADQPDAFVDEEVQLLSEIAANVAHSLHLLRLRQKQQQDEAAVRRHRSQLQAIFDASSASILQVDINGQILLANKSMMEMFGYTREQLPEVSYFDLVDPSQYEMVRANLPSQLQVDAERLYRRRDGTTFWGHLLGRRMPELPDMVPCMIAIITDSTERKATEEALQSAKDEAVQANKAKNIFLASISHEIRTPLHAVINLGYLASLHVLDPVIGNYLLKIQEAGRTLSRIIDDLLDLSKVDAGALVMEKIPFDLSEVLHHLMTLVNTLNDKQLQLHVDVDPDMPQALQGDPQRLGQVLLNLMSNAIKFTDQGSVTLKTELVQPGDREVLLRFTVTDTGCGMDAQQLQRIFQPFYQGNHAHGRRQGGAGLGLAISHHLVMLMGGEFCIESQPGQGSRFAFTAAFGTLEAIQSGGESPATPLGLSEGMSTSLEQMSGAKVLVVEDVEINQMIITELLQRVGLEVMVAGGGLRAMELLERHTFELVLLDLKMPDLDGWEVARRLRAIPRLRELPVIAMTAYAFSSDRQSCLEAGMNDHLAKPIDRNLLYAALRRWIRPAVRSASPLAFGLEPHAAFNPESHAHAHPERRSQSPAAIHSLSNPSLDPLFRAQSPSGIHSEAMAAGDAAFTPVVSLSAIPDPGAEPLLPAHLPGIDQKTGLDRVLGNELLYRVLLRKFAQTHARFDVDLLQLLQQGDGVVAQHRLHTLGGVAGNLGAKELMHASRALECVCVEGYHLDDPELAGGLNRFLSSFAQVMTSVMLLQETSADVSRSLESAVLDRVRPQLENLAELVREGNIIEAMHASTQLLPWVAHTPWVEELEQLTEHLFDGNLVLAVTVVHHLAERLIGPGGAAGTAEETV